MKEWWIVDGVMPERALDKLQKAGICVENAKKTQKKRIVFCINKKDCEKAFAIFPNMCYNNTRESVYSFARVGEKALRAREIFKKRSMGAILGTCLFCAIVAFSSSLVVRLEFVGSDVYRREIKEILQTEGIKLYAPYEKGKETAISANVLSLEGVEFCSVQKVGNALRIEIRTNAFASLKREQGSLVSPTKATVISIVALSGTPLKKSGESVEQGETLIADAFTLENGENNPTTAVGKAKLLCEKNFLGKNEAELESQARLFVETQGGELVSLATEQDGSLTVRYTLVVKKNM